MITLELAKDFLEDLEIPEHYVASDDYELQAGHLKQLCEAVIEVANSLNKPPCNPDCEYLAAWYKKHVLGEREFEP